MAHNRRHCFVFEILSGLNNLGAKNVLIAAPQKFSISTLIILEKLL
jgi:hypothetical protein